MDWCQTEGFVADTNEDLLMVYFDYLVNKKNVAICPKFSHLKQQVLVYQGKDNSGYATLRAYCKRAAKAGETKKAPAFTEEQILRLLTTA